MNKKKKVDQNTIKTAKRLLKYITETYKLRLILVFVCIFLSAVDTRTDALIRKAFREEIPNTTKIIIAQRVSSIEDADQIIVLDDGKIAGVGTSEELLKTNDIYREVYESQVKGGGDDE